MLHRQYMDRIYTAMYFFTISFLFNLKALVIVISINVDLLSAEL